MRFSFKASRDSILDETSSTKIARAVSKPRKFLLTDSNLEQSPKKSNSFKGCSNNFAEPVNIKKLCKPFSIEHNPEVPSSSNKHEVFSTSSKTIQKDLNKERQKTFKAQYANHLAKSANNV